MFSLSPAGMAKTLALRDHNLPTLPSLCRRKWRREPISAHVSLCKEGVPVFSPFFKSIFSIELSERKGEGEEREK